MDPQSVTQQLCLACGLCCNGVLFRDVKLDADDDQEILRQSGLALRPAASGREGVSLPQPCAALCADNRCRVYGDRPGRCRAFECALFKAVVAENIAAPDALKTIRATRRQVEKVQRLLARIGELDEGSPLRLRFRRICRRMDRSTPGAAVIATFGELTQEMHALNVSLSTNFYPGNTPDG